MYLRQTTILFLRLSKRGARVKREGVQGLSQRTQQIFITWPFKKSGVQEVEKCLNRGDVMQLVRLRVTSGTFVNPCLWVC